MANSSSTQVIDSSTTTNAPLPLSYGYIWATGKRLQYYMLQNTGNDYLDYTRVGFWALGEGEIDGCHELWINDDIVWTSEWDDPSQFHFHRGSDATIGAGLYPSSSGPDQGVDSFFSSFPSAIQPLAYSRVAYYAIKRKQPIQNQTNTHQNDPTQWTDVAPIGLWRGLRVRLFDEFGNQTAYAFTTNPAWHIVDVILRRKIFPEYNIDLINGIDEISAMAQNRFDWGSIVTAARYFDTFLANGRRRFTGNYAFSSQATLAAILEQMLKNCRSFIQEYGGKISLKCDAPRSSVFTISRQHVLAGSLDVNDKAVSTAGNSYVGKFRDLLVPAAAAIASITCSDHANPVVATEGPHPFNNLDRIAIGGTNTIYDGTWTVASVPTGTEVTTFTLTRKGSNYPASVGAGGSIGLLYSRFKERAPVFIHKQNQYARGMVGLGLPRQLNSIRTELDFGVTTFDQASRLARYERDRTLGIDQSPYVTPAYLTVVIPLLSADAAGSGAAAIQIQDGDRITLDDKASYAYAGDYEVLEHKIRPFNASTSSGEGTIMLSADASGGELELSLGPYNETVMYDSTDPNSAGWSNVPGSDPGNDSNYTAIALADGGLLAFFTGSVSSGNTFDLPSSGFNTGNVFAWVGPQGFLVSGGGRGMRAITLCDVDGNRRCTLEYTDGSGVWSGDMNYACSTWLGDSTAASSATVGGFHFEIFTLAGGEVICFGKGVVAHGTAVVLPTGFDFSKAFMAAYPHDSAVSGSNYAHWVGAYVDSSHNVNFTFKDGEGHVWHGNAQVLIFAWKNNSGSVVTSTVGGNPWMTYANSDGFTLGVGLGSNMANGATFVLPSAAGAGDSLQVICGSHAWDYPDNGHHAHGISSCYLDSNNIVNMLFQDGEGNFWSGTADVFALFYEPTSTGSMSAGGILILVTPASMSVALGGTVQYSASVAGTSTTSVTWSVDGIVGGNSTVGTITTGGLYTAPSTNGSHVIAATSTVNSAAYGLASVSVGSGSGTTGTAITISLLPSLASISPGGSVTFTPTITGTTSTAVTWAVSNSLAGSITSGGVFTALSTFRGTVSVIATLTAYPSISDSSTVSIGTGGGFGGTPRLPVCFIRGAEYMTTSGLLSNEEIHSRWEEGEDIFLIGRRGPERIASAEWVIVPAWYRMRVDGFKEFGCSESTTFVEMESGVHMHAFDLVEGMCLETRIGFCELTEITLVNEPIEVLFIHLEGPSHEYLVAGGVWSHNFLKSFR